MMQSKQRHQADKSPCYHFFTGGGVAKAIKIRHGVLKVNVQDQIDHNMWNSA